MTAHVPPPRGAYSPRVAELFATTPGAGRPADREGWVAAEAHDPLTGTHVRWYLKDGEGRLVGVRYEVRGCPHTIAATAAVAEALSGQPSNAVRIDVAAVAAALVVPPEKLGRLFVVEDAVRSAALLLVPARP
jgi:NifU-like protein involved in Fe-S cluster formation